LGLPRGRRNRLGDLGGVFPQSTKKPGFKIGFQGFRIDPFIVYEVERI
jgi:hypothetical protein